MPVRMVSVELEELERCRELVRYVPGYCGYRLKELRRRLDKKLRCEVARMLLDSAARLEIVEKEAFLSGGSPAARPLSKARKRLVELSEKMRAASRRGRFFEREEIPTQCLKELMEADGELLRLADEVTKCVSKLERTDIPSDEKECRSRYLEDTIERLSAAYDARAYASHPARSGPSLDAARRLSMRYIPLLSGGSGFGGGA